jgi:leader peptidase (prepilin peptidase)/N-methyltransferase
VPVTSSSTSRSIRAAAAIVATALVAACFGRFGFGADGFIAAFLCLVLVFLTVTDIESRRIPNAVVLPAAFAVLIARILFSPGREIQWPIAGIAAAAVLLIVALVHPPGLGMGDVKLALLVGFGLGESTVLALLLGLAAAAVYSVALLVRRGSEARTATFALGPFLALGAVLALLVA